MSIRIGGGVGVSATASGPLPIEQGGTGQITASAAINALVPPQAGEGGHILGTNGTNVLWVAAGSGAGTVTSVGITPGAGISVSGSPITSSGSMTVTNTGVTSNVAGTGIGLSGSTGAVTINNTGVTKITAGTNISITPTGGTGDVTINAAGGGGTPGGTDTQIQFNDAGSFGGSSNLTINKITGVVNFVSTPTIDGLEIGYRVVPRVTIFNSDARGKRVAVTAGFTVPAATYAAGDAFSFYNDSAAAITITQGAGLTLRQDGTTNTGNRSLAARGSCFIWFNSASEAIINGSIT